MDISVKNEIRGRLLGIDHGQRVIGLAISDPTQRLARPLQLFTRTTRVADFAALNSIVTEYQAVGIVVGLPETPPDFAGTSQSETVERWAARLAGQVSTPVYLWNETLSTDEAEHLLVGGRHSRAERVDHVAAAIILQSFLDAHPPGTSYPVSVRPGRHSRQ